MKIPIWVWTATSMILLFCGGMFFFEVSTYSVLPSDEGGMGFWKSFTDVWDTSFWFYSTTVFLSLFLVLAVMQMKSLVMRD